MRLLLFFPLGPIGWLILIVIVLVSIFGKESK